MRVSSGVREFVLDLRDVQVLVAGSYISLRPVTRVPVPFLTAPGLR